MRVGFFFGISVALVIGGTFIHYLTSNEFSVLSGLIFEWTTGVPREGHTAVCSAVIGCYTISFLTVKQQITEGEEFLTLTDCFDTLQRK